MDSQLNIVGLARVKNEARWIRRMVTSMLACCKEVVVMDDHSDDATAAEAVAAGAYVIASPYDTFNEARDKQWLYDFVISTCSPGWCLMLDGDEELGPGAAEAIEAVVRTQGTIESYRVSFTYLWNNEQTKRVDRWYGAPFTRASLWRCAPGQRFCAGNSASLHCGSTPAGLREHALPIADVLHYGYMHAADRIRKYEYYNRIDPNNEFEDCYRHMVIGDILPASYAGKWAGPLKLEPVK